MTDPAASNLLSAAWTALLHALLAAPTAWRSLWRPAAASPPGCRALSSMHRNRRRSSADRSGSSGTGWTSPLPATRRSAAKCRFQADRPTADGWRSRTRRQRRAAPQLIQCFKNREHFFAASRLASLLQRAGRLLWERRKSRTCGIENGSNRVKHYTRIMRIDWNLMFDRRIASGRSVSRRIAESPEYEREKIHKSGMCSIPPPDSTLKAMQVLFGQCAPLALAQIAQRQTADGHADQAQGGDVERV